MFKKKKNTNTPQEQRNAPTVMSGQRVNSYYTASKKQITTFQRHTESSSRNSTLPLAKKLKKYVFMGLGALLLLVAIIAMFTLNKDASITIEHGGSYRSAADYKQIVADALSKSFKNNLKLSLDSNAVEQELKQQLPEAYNVAVYAPLFGRSPEVIITTAKPFAVLLQTGAPSMLMSDRGRLIIESGKTSVDTTKLSTISNQSGTQYKVADQLFKPDEMTALSALQFQFNSTSGEEGAVAYILPTAPREIHTKEGSYIAKFSLNEDANIVQQFGALRAVQSQMQAQKTSPKEYIDVRLATKVFIK